MHVPCLSLDVKVLYYRAEGDREAKKRPSPADNAPELETTPPAAKPLFCHGSHWLQGPHLGMGICTLRTVALSQGNGSCFPMKIQAAKIDSFSQLA